MKINLARWDRGLRYILGFLLTCWAAAGGPWWGWIGVYLIMSASWGFCVLYAYFHLRTASPPEDRVRELH